MAANAQSVLYSLPKESSHFENSLNSHLKNSQEIIIITPSMNYPSLRRKLIKAISKGSKLTLITKNPLGDPVALVAYHDVTLLLYRETSLKNTIIIVDNSFACHHQGSLDENDRMDERKKIVCTNEMDTIYPIVNTINRFRTHAKPYLE